MEHGFLYLVLACIFGFFMAWGIGANDVANAMATSVGSKVFTISQAILVAAIFEFLGAYLAGGSVTNTISSGITNINFFLHSPQILVYGMLAALLAAGIWLFIASNYGWPVSTTHSIVGSIIGFTIASFGFNAVNWHQVLAIVLSWVISPLMGGGLAFLIFSSIKKLILNAEYPLYNAKKYMPIYIFFMITIISMITFTNGLKHIHIDLLYWQSLAIAVLIGATIMIISYGLLNKITAITQNRSEQFAKVEKIFGKLMMFTACAMAFAHGSNDVANAVGPLSAIVTTVSHYQYKHLIGNNLINQSILLLGALGIVTGLASYGYRVINTVGKNITELTPTRGFSAEVSTALTVVIASGSGIPVSTTHTLVGAILGIGFARGIGALNIKVVNRIFMSWIITLPAGAGLAILIFYLISLLS